MRLSTDRLVGALAVALALGNLGRLPFVELGGRPGAVSLMDLLLIPIWLLLLIKLPAGARRWRLEGVSLSLLLFIAVAALSTGLAGPRWGLSVGAWVSSAAFLLRWVLYAGVFILIVSDPDAPAASARGWRMLERMVLVVAAFGLVQAAVLPDFGIRVGALTGIPADPQGHRLVSTLFDPQHAGGLLAIGVLIRVAMVAEGVPTPPGPLLLLGTALLLTVSRSAILGGVAGFAVIVLVRGFPPALRRLLAIGGAVLLPVVPALVAFARGFNKLEVDGSAMQRIIPWVRSLTIIADHPVLGAGFNAAAHAQRAYGWRAIGGSDATMDGGLLFVAVMTGLLGLAAYGLMLAAVWRAARRTWGTMDLPAETRGFAVGAVAATVAILVQSLFTSSLLVPWVMVPLWVVWARVVSCAPPTVPRWVGSRRPPRVAPALVASGLLLVTGGCEPCAGVANCSGEARRVLTGTILSRATQGPRAGLSVAAEGQATVTNQAGRWTLTLPPGGTQVDVAVGGDRGYVARAVPVAIVRRTGDATELGAWYDTPAFGYRMGFSYRGALLPNPEARFELDPSVGGGSLVAVAVGGGYLRFAGEAPRAGDVPGRLIVTHPIAGRRVYEDAVLVADYALRVETVRETFPLDRVYRYGGGVVDRGTFEASPGSVVTFTRTAGLELAQNPVVATAREFGFFTLDIEPLGRGRIVGDLRITPPNGRASYLYRDFALTTYDSSDVRSLGLVAHGERWDWVVELRRMADSSAVTWTPFEFVRTEGLALVAGDTLRGSSNGSGRLLLRAFVRDTGTVTGVLTVRPSGQPPVVVGTFRLRTFAADSQQFAGVRHVPLP